MFGDQHWSAALHYIQINSTREQKFYEPFLTAAFLKFVDCTCT